MERLRLGELSNLASLGILVVALLGGFSRHTREKIYDRARKKNGGRLASEISGRDDEPLQCAHINHDKSHPDYDKPIMGILVTLSEHLYDPKVGHIPASKKQVQPNGRLPNGLTKRDNEWAIGSLRSQIKRHRANQAAQELRARSDAVSNTWPDCR